MNKVGSLMKAVVKLTTSIADLGECRECLQNHLEEGVRGGAMSAISDAMYALDRRRDRLEDKLELQIYREKEKSDE